MLNLKDKYFLVNSNGNIIKNKCFFFYFEAFQLLIISIMILHDTYNI